jgi:D-aspartate ligase
VTRTTTASTNREQDASALRAVVIGDLDLVRPVRWAGAEVTAIGRADGSTRFSRDVRGWHDLPADADDEALLDLLESLDLDLDLDPATPRPLFYQGDRELLAIDRHRQRLAERFAFVLPPVGVVPDLVDKARFQGLAERTGLPVPPATVVHPSDLRALDIAGPVLIKPLTRAGDWRGRGFRAKAVVAHRPADLRAIADRAGDALGDLLVQQLIPGGEERIESYHVYVDTAGSVVGEFTGRKLRTWPEQFGFTSALEITDSPEVRAFGRRVVEQVGLVGVAKLDAKRGPDGRLWLLEINPRFNLWHLPGALAGVNLPALVLADLTGRPRPVPTTARPGVTWSAPTRDLRAARAAGMPMTAWLRWTARSDAYHDLSARDPSPTVRGTLAPAIRRRLAARG